VPAFRCVHCGLYLLKTAQLYLTHTLARYAILGGERFKLRGSFAQLARREYVFLAGIKRLNGSFQGLVPSGQFLVFGYLNVVSGRRVNKPFESVARISAVVCMQIQGKIAAQAAVHIHNFTLGHIET
jgi:hypothetical protein